MKTERVPKFGAIFLLATISIFLLSGCGSNKPPSISFSISPNEGQAPLEASFDATRSEDPDGEIDNYLWSFGDGVKGSGKIVKHTYEDDGTYEVTLTLTDNKGKEASETQTIDVKNSPPQPTLTAEPKEGESPLEVTFDLSGSSDPNGAITDFELAFGDGNSSSGEDILKKVSHTYESAGDYEAKATLTDDDGATASTTLQISVQEPPPPNKPPVAEIDADKTEGTAPLEVTFDAEASEDPDGEIVSYNWEFGDGESASGKEVTHEFTEPGEYEVTLTVVDDRDGTSSSTEEITVEEAVYSLGEAGSNGNVEITLLDAYIQDQIGEHSPEEGDFYVIIDLRVKALKGEQYPSKSIFRLQDNAGRTSDVSLDTSLLDNYIKSPILKEGETARGKIAFSARQSASYTLIYDSPQRKIRFRFQL